MDMQRLTEKAQEALIASQRLATSLGHPQIDPEHLLLTLVRQSGGIVPDVLRKMQVDPRPAFTSAYNSLRTFLDEQGNAFANKERDNIGGDPLVRELRNTLGRTLTNELATGGSFSSVTQVGLTLSRTGTLELRPADLQAA